MADRPVRKRQLPQAIHRLVDFRSLRRLHRKRRPQLRPTQEPAQPPALGLQRGELRRRTALHPHAGEGNMERQGQRHKPEYKREQHDAHADPPDNFPV